MIKQIFAVNDTINEALFSSAWSWLRARGQNWLRPVVMFGVLLASFGLGYLNQPRLMLVALALPMMIGGGLVLLHWPPLGLLLLVGSIAIPFNGPSNSNLTLALSAAISGLWILDMLLLQQKIRLISSITFKPLFALVLVATLAFCFGQLNWYTFAPHAPLGAQLGGLSLFYLSAGVYLVAAHRIVDLHWLRWLVWLFLILGATVIFSWIVPGRIGEMIGYFFTVQTTGSLFWTWLLTHAFSQAVFNTDLHRGWRWALGGLGLATFYVMVTHLWTWNSGWVPPLVSVFAIVLIAFPRLGMLSILAGTVAAVARLSEIISSIMVGDNEYSLATRLEAWVILWNVVKVNPVLGLGPANYYWYTPLFPIRGYAVQFNSHQQYADLVLQTGLLGLICFVAFFLAVGWLAWHLRYRVPAGFPKAYVYGALGGVAGTFTASVFGDWVIPFFYNVNLGGFRASMLSWLFFGGLLALQQMINASTTHSPLRSRNL